LNKNDCVKRPSSRLRRRGETNTRNRRKKEKFSDRESEIR